MFHQVDALLHTMRCIGQYEDALCELSHEIKKIGGLSPETGDELREILGKIPSHDFLLDLDAVKNSLRVENSTIKSSSRKVAKAAAISNRSTAVKRDQAKQD